MIGFIDQTTYSAIPAIDTHLGIIPKLSPLLPKNLSSPTLNAVVTGTDNLVAVGPRSGSVWIQAVSSAAPIHLHL